MAGIATSSRGLTTADIANLQSGGVYRVNTLSNAKSNYYSYDQYGVKVPTFDKYGVRVPTYDQYGSISPYNPSASSPATESSPNPSVGNAPTQSWAGMRNGLAVMAADAAGTAVGGYIGERMAGTLGREYGKAAGASAAAAAYAGYVTGGNPAAAAMAGALAGMVSLAGSAMSAANEWAGSEQGAKKARDAYDKASQRADQALKNKQSAQPFNTKGGTATKTATDASPFFNSLDKTDGWYRVYKTKANPDGLVLKEAITDPSTTFSWRYDNPDSLSLLRLIVNGVESYPQGTDGSDVYAVNWYLVGLGIVIRSFPPLPSTNSTPPLDSPKQKDTDKNPGTSPDYFPYAPTVNFNPDLAPKPDPKLNPAYDNRPYKEPEKPSFAPPPSPSPKVAPNPLADSNPSYKSPPASNPNSGEKPAYESKPYVAPAFVAKPYISGVSPKSEYGKSIDANTGLTYDEWKKQYGNPTPVDTSRSTSDPNVSPSQSPNPLTKPLNPPIVEKPQTTPNTTPTGDTNDTAKILLGVGAVAATVAAIKVGSDALVNASLSNTPKIDQIANNTTPQAQQTNAQQGVCDAMQPNQCGFEGVKAATTAATNPIKDQTIANGGALSSIANLLATMWEFLQGNIGKIKNFLDNSIIDRAMGAANFAMNVHNALMLSNSLGKTLAGVVDTAMNLTPFQFTDTEGRKTTATRAFSQNVSSMIVNLIGQDLYTELTDDWKVANRIYQSGTNLLNKTERLLGAQSKVAQKSGIDVANIGNALRANGIVNPNSYPPMAATKEANTPTDLLADINSPLASLQAGVKNLNAVTKSVSGTIKQVTAIQKEFGKLQDLTNKESKVRKSMRTQSARQAKIKAKFTMIQIKQIKAKGQKNANP